jgi:hypothetical protein
MSTKYVYSLSLTANVNGHLVIGLHVSPSCDLSDHTRLGFLVVESLRGLDVISYQLFAGKGWPETWSEVRYHAARYYRGGASYRGPIAHFQCPTDSSELASEFPFIGKLGGGESEIFSDNSGSDGGLS